MSRRVFQLYNPFDMRGVSPAEALLRASSFSVVIAIVSILIKGLALWQSGSVSVLAALTDSGLDLLASLTTYFAVRFARTPPDEEHPFGHGKAEAFSALFQAAMVFASAGLVGKDCLDNFLHPKPIQAYGLAIGVMSLSILLTFLLVSVQTRALKAQGSVAISADRSHYLLDLATNGIALIGVIGSMMHIAVLDSIAGLCVVAILVKGAIGVLREAADHLMDKAMEPEDVKAIAELIREDNTILGLHDLRTRTSGPYVQIQMHVDLDPHLTLTEAHKILIKAENRILAVYPNADILLHADPKGMAEEHGGVFKEA